MPQGTAPINVPTLQQNTTPKQDCERSGGIWDEEKQVCLRLGDPEAFNKQQSQGLGKNTINNKDTIKKPEVFVDEATKIPSGFTTADGRSFLGVNPEQAIRGVTSQQDLRALPEGVNPVGTESTAIRQQQEAQALSRQVGQFGQLEAGERFLGGVDPQEALTQGVIGSLPGALRLAVAGAGVGLAEGALVGSVVPGAGTAAGATAGAVIGGSAGLISGIASGIISSSKGQRRDTVNAQKRVLDEGKQRLNDWAILAATDPANKHFYVSQFNLQLSEIDQAYRQMKFDTTSDVAKFETALPDLAEFEAFYSFAGERDVSILKMNQALVGPTNIDYEFLELQQRRQNDN